MKYTLAVLVDNKPGVLTHIAGLISRRAFNIESIAAGHSEEPDITRINIVVDVDDEFQLDQVINQLSNKKSLPLQKVHLLFVSFS